MTAIPSKSSLKRVLPQRDKHEPVPSKRSRITQKSTEKSQPTTAKLVTRPKVKASTTVSNPLPKNKLRIYVCGDGSGGELGLGSGKRVTNVRAPRPNSNLTEVVDIATGGMHAAALTLDYKILTWGINDMGTLARDTSWEEPVRDVDEADDDSSEDDVPLNPLEATPIIVPEDSFALGSRFVQVTAGDSSTLALTHDGLVHGWGIFRDSNGPYAFTYDKQKRFQPGTHNIVREPLLLEGLKDITQISAGADFALALDIRGRVFAWGCGQQCELGRRLIDRRRPEALLPSMVELPSRVKIVSIRAAANHAFAIDTDGDTWTWGSNNFGQTGISLGAGQGEAVVSRPTKIPSLTGKKMKMVAGGLHHSIGLTDDGECLVWGRVDGGQSGLDLTQLLQDDPDSILCDSRNRPRILLRPKKLPIPLCSYIAAGSDHCLAVTTEGHAYSWGFNSSYQCGLGNEDDITVPTKLQGKHIKEQKLVWVGAGGQYSMFGSVAQKH